MQKHDFIDISSINVCRHFLQQMAWVYYEPSVVLHTCLVLVLKFVINFKAFYFNYFINLYFPYIIIAIFN